MQCGLEKRLSISKAQDACEFDIEIRYLSGKCLDDIFNLLGFCFI